MNPLGEERDEEARRARDNEMKRVKQSAISLERLVTRDDKDRFESREDKLGKYMSMV